MKYLFLFLTCLICLSLYEFSARSLPTIEQVGYNKWLYEVENTFVATKGEVFPDIVIDVVSEKKPDLAWKITNAKSHKNDAKMLRILTQLKLAGVFSGSLKDKHNALAVTVTTSDNKFNGIISREKMKQDIRTQVLIKLLDMYE
ncbi:MAG: hypothetical protein ACOX2O_04220 [Bdellovibrionota bacterium]|jgi:hypothetical protein